VADLKLSIQTLFKNHLPTEGKLMKINILYGTESGGGELTAEDIAESLSAQYEMNIQNMSETDVRLLDKDAFYIMICSTYGEGELPYSAQPFHAALLSEKPDLAGLRYAMFGRGDSAYLKTYSRGSEIIDETLQSLGATRVGEYGRHDASDMSVTDELAISWANAVIENI
jgi:MioC protein